MNDEKLLLSSAAAFDCLPDAIVAVDAAGSIRVFNQHAEKLFGYKAEEVLGQLIEILVPAEFKALHVAYRQSYLDSPGRYCVGEVREVTALHKNGSEFPVDITLSPQRIDNAQFVFAAIRDATQRVLLENRLSDSEERYRLVVNNSKDVIFRTNVAGEWTFLNPAWTEITGFQLENSLGRLFLDFVHPEDRERHMAFFQDIIDQVRAYCRDEFRYLVDLSGKQEQFRIRDAGNAFRWIEVHCRGLVDETTGEVLGTTGVLRDITGRKQAEQELQRLNKHIRLLLESAGEGIFGVNDTGHCTFINAAALEILGYTYEEFHGINVHDAIHHTRTDGSYYPIKECPVYQSFNEGERRYADNEVLWRKDGTSFPADYSSYPIVEDGKTTGAVVVFRNVAEARAMSREMDYLARHDSLTGLINRHEFEVRLNNALISAHGDGAEHVLCYLDLDQFKVVNDTTGHVAGDELLRQLSTILHTKIRQGDTLARLGGDEFGILLEHCLLDQALLIIEELKQTVQEFRFIWEDLTFAIGVSIGVVAINQDTVSVATALSSADTACYMAKDKGRNRIHVYQADDAEVAQRHGEMQWVAKIHDAFEYGNFYLAYQPIIPVETNAGRNSHFEILIRMHDDVGHVIPPGSFLPAAERYNLMPTVDRWVIRTAFNWLDNNRIFLDKIELCSINLSGHSLGDDFFLEFILAQFQRQKIPPGKICFEITETTAVANLSAAIQFMKSLKRSGCRFALDDFGSGMSSFAYLKNLPVDFLKIDGNFIRDIVHDPVDRAMVEAINQVGHVMGLSTIAEFVENDAILEQLKHIGVDYAQGFGIAKPRPLHKFKPD